MKSAFVVSCVAVAALAGSAMAQPVSLSSNFNQTVLATWTNTLDATAPRFNRPVILGISTPSTDLSTSATLVRYGVNTVNFADAGNYLIATSWNRSGFAGQQLQYRYGSGGFSATSPLTNNLGGMTTSGSRVGNFNYVISAPAGPMTFVSSWSSNTSSFGTMTTTIIQDPGLLADATGSPSVPATANFTVSSSSTDLVQTLDSIRIRGLKHTWSSQLQFTISNGTTSVVFFTNPNSNFEDQDFDGDYTFLAGGPAMPTADPVIPSGQIGTTEDFTTAFSGASIGGTWTLSVTDIDTGYTGRIAGFDLNFTAVPTPGTAALLGLGGLLAGRRRR